LNIAAKNGGNFCNFHVTAKGKPSHIGRKFAQSGTDVMILKIFSPKISATKMAFLTQNKAKLCKNLIITLVFEKKKFRRKLSKIAEKL
jgi:hypothetical protein